MKTGFGPCRTTIKKAALIGFGGMPYYNHKKVEYNKGALMHSTTND